MFLESIVDIVNRAKAMFPHEPKWVELAQQLYEQSIREDRTDPPPSPSSTSPSDDPQRCPCCQLAAIEDEGLCHSCQALYKIRPADMSMGICDCGHLPGGKHIYIYKSRQGDKVFCSTACLRRNWLDLFGFFVRRLPCKR